MRKFRTIWKFLTPGWLQEDQGGRLLYSLGLLKDAFAERMRQSAWLTLPSIAAADALSLLGADRGMPRGLFEPTATYRGRLAAWRFPKGHRVRGTAGALLEQVAIALRSTEQTTVDQRGTEYRRDAAGVVTVTRDAVWDWDGDALLPNWGRYWVVVRSTGAPWPAFTDGAWGDTVLAPEDVALAGSGIHPGEVSAVRRVASNARLGWTPAGRRAIYLVIYFPADPYPVPDGTWDVWANRDPAYRYVPLNASVT